MQAIETAQERGRMPAQPVPVRSRSRIQRNLLICGVLTAPLYAFTDVLGGLLHDRYSFTAQAVSELAAIGTASQPYVTPLFMLYDVLAIAFGIGALRESGHNRALRIAGLLVIGYASLGLVGYTFSPVHQRGAGGVTEDLAHIIVTAGVVLLLLLAIGAGAFAFGRRFRIYSFATIVTVLVFGALTVPFPAQVAAGRPTPGFGIIERVVLYASLVWVTVLAAALLRRPAPVSERRLA